MDYIYTSLIFKVIAIACPLFRFIRSPNDPTFMELSNVPFEYLL